MDWLQRLIQTVVGEDPKQVHGFTRHAAGVQERLQLPRAGDHHLAGLTVVLGIQGLEVDVGAGVVAQTAIRVEAKAVQQ